MKDKERITKKTTGKAVVHATAEPEKKRKVCIVGYAPSSRDLAPYDDPSWEIWGVNELYKLGKRIDVLFEMHNRKWFKSKERNPQHLEWLQNSPVPIFMLQTYDDIPKSVRYPIEDIKKFFAPYEDYFTNSVSYMLALAIMLNVDEIAIYGIDMATHEEYLYQRPSVEFFAGIAQGIYKATGKCKIYIPPQCDLLKVAFMYGYEDDQITASKKRLNARKQELQARANAAMQQSQQFQRQYDQLIGALDDMNYVDRCLWVYDKEKTCT